MDTLNRWQDRTEIVLGIWLCLAPWLLSLPEAAAWCAIVVGVFVIVFAVEDTILPNQIEEWANTVLGLGLMISPWAWGYSDDVRATVNAVVSGLLVTGFAFWALERLFLRHEKDGEVKHT